jgi:hypothetical protein
MDWISLLLVAVFFVLPLVQELLKARRKATGQPEELPPGMQEAEEFSLPGLSDEVDQRQSRGPSTTPDRGYDDVPVGRDRSARVEEANRGVRPRATRREPSREAPGRDERVRDRAARSNPPVEGQVRRPRASSVPTRPPPRSRAVQGKQTNQPAIRRQLGTIEGLRSSIILGEVLGPPVSMRDPDQKV